MLFEILAHNIHTEFEVWAFGSRVSGKAHSGSDLDLVLRAKNKKPIDSNELMRLKQNLRNSNIPFLVEVMDWERIPNYFKDNISEQYQVLKPL